MKKMLNACHPRAIGNLFVAARPWRALMLAMGKQLHSFAVIPNPIGNLLEKCSRTVLRCHRDAICSSGILCRRIMASQGDAATSYNVVAGLVPAKNLSRDFRGRTRTVPILSICSCTPLACLFVIAGVI